MYSIKKSLHMIIQDIILHDTTNSKFDVMIKMNQLTDSVIKSVKCSLVNVYIIQWSNKMMFEFEFEFININSTA